MEISREALDSAEILHLNGRLIIGPPAQALESQVHEVLESGATKVVIEMSGVDYIDSAGLGTLIGCLGEAKEAGVGIRVAAITDRVRLILKVTATEKVMPLDDDVASAIESLA